MPAQANTTGKKKFNPTITALFDAPKFGLKDPSGNAIEGTALLSANINAEGFKTVQESLQIGSKLLVRQSPRLNKSGGRTFYLEILPPLAEPANRYRTAGNDDI